MLDPVVQDAMDAMSGAHDLKRWDEVVALGDAWVEARGGMHPLSCCHYAEALMATGDPVKARRWARVAYENVPASDVVVKMAAAATYARALSRTGRYGRAKRILRELTEIDPSTLNRASVLTGASDLEIQRAIDDADEKRGHVMATITDRWADAWALMEKRLQDGKHAIPEGAHLWDGATREPVALLHEQGLGDCILMLRWYKHVEAVTGVPVVWYGPKMLHRWVEGCGVRVGGTELHDVTERAVVYTMSLPHVCGVKRRDDVPAPVAPALPRTFRRDGLTVGVCWKGAAGGWHNFERSYGTAEFAEIVRPLDGVTWVNLCHDADVGDLPLERVTFGDVYDTAERVASCDLVVTVDTSVAHLAGSLGIATLCLVPTVPDWRYAWPWAGGSPFYPSMTVLRRQTAVETATLVKARRLLEQFRRAMERAA